MTYGERPRLWNLLQSSGNNTLTFGPPRLIQRISVRGSRGDGEYERRQRLYRVDEMRAALEHAGLSVVAVFGNSDRTPFDPALSSTMWIVAERAV
jgi:hypothetical protein